MPYEATLPVFTADDAAAEINARFAPKDACGVIAHALTARGRIALVSSFGAESVVLLHMAAAVDRAVPVLFVETGMLFAETLSYQRRVAERLGLSNVRIVRPDPVQLLTRDTDGLLHQSDTDACCTLRKVEPLANALLPYDGWISGRKRIHGGQRIELELAEAEGERLKLNPLAHWSGTEIAAYMEAHDLPRHPLTAKGYGSIGCAPCTRAARPGEAPRAGRWPGQDKTECGIHFIDGKAVRP
ncbi:phosphoadenylyl-sulfate reductase [Sinisalibacter aestuarii]|uniref:Adenosine 5'-phosphosulfate reductase n=1 Tax=Sinisalibacter aestuarii TaxID=2949426 RepID=A0ABQ5LWX2_9RHOB|nr:phosphoadenylyl-sulfate reductase [Sinisalibacter aestuarii]GKY89468.1 phosphoadenylyl-sulfate reductase [Sinisalibacter aestuarii]